MAVGVTVTVAVTGLGVILVPVKAGMFPVPLAARPILTSEFVHAKIVPGEVLVGTPSITFAPLQTVTFEGTTTIGVGFIVIV